MKEMPGADELPAAGHDDPNHAEVAARLRALLELTRDGLAPRVAVPPHEKLRGIKKRGA